MSKENNLLNLSTAFAPVLYPPKVCHDPVAEEDIVDTLIIDGYEQDQEGNIRPKTVQKEVKRYNRKKYIESFSDDVGLDNIIKKISQGAIAEDKFSILSSNKPGEVNDLTGFQDVENIGDIHNMVAKARASFDALDPDLKKDMSFKEFCSKFTNEDLTKYFAAKEKAAKPEGGEK